MYQPRHFAQDDPQALRALLDAHPFATLVSTGEGGLTADHLPFVFDPDDGTQGALHGHVARANPVWQRADAQPVLAVFQGVQAYVSPNWYPSKAEHHKAVPTWNYTVVHAHGVLRAVTDVDWLRGLVERLTARHEAGREQPWSIDEAPPDYLAQMLKAIVGVRIELTQLVGKWKLSQNRSEADRAGVADGLAADGAEAMAALIRPEARPRPGPAR